MAVLSSLTAYTPLPENSDATPGLWDRRFEIVHSHADRLNVSSAASSDAAIGWGAGSITTTLNTSAGTLSVLTIGAASGNTVSLSTWGLSASTISMLHGLVALGSIGTLRAYSGNTILILSHLSLNNKRIEQMGEPSAASDAATKNYVDFLLSAGVPSFRGSWFVNSAGVSVTTRDLVYINSTGSLALADSNHSTTCPIGGVFIALGLVSTPSNVTCGLVGEVGGFTSLTTGSIYFVHTTAGGITATAPSGTSDVVMVAGIAKSNVTLLFDPQYVSSNSTG